MSRSTTPAVSPYRLVVHRENKSASEHQLEDGRSVFIGKSGSCGIHVEGTGVAEIHCLIDVEGETVSIQDWASEAGTIINGNRIDDKTVLGVGDSIVLGNLRMELVGGTGSATIDEVPDEIKCDEEPIHIDADLETEDQDIEVLEVDSHDDVQPELELDLSNEESPTTQSSFDMSDQRAEDDLDWDPGDLDEDEIDPEIVSLLKSEIEDLRIQLAERDEQLAASSAEDDRFSEPSPLPIGDRDFGSADLAARVDSLLEELEEHDDRVATLQELLQTAEIQNQAEREERNCLETWVSEIEQRIGQRESEVQAEQDALRDRLEEAFDERNKFQQQLHAARKRLGGKSVDEGVDDELLKQLQRQNADMHSQLEEANKQVASLTRQIERLKNEDPDSLQSIRAELAKEKADVSRMRFQLSKQLEDIGNVPVAKDQPDREFAYKLKTLREHLREIHEEEKADREQKSDSLLGRISNLWKRVDDEY